MHIHLLLLLQHECAGCYGQQALVCAELSAWFDSVGVTVRSYRVMYDLLDDMRAAMEGKLAALEQRIPIGEAEVRAVFGKGSKLVAGCMVTEGSLREDCFVVVGLSALFAWQFASDDVTISYC